MPHTQFCHCSVKAAKTTYDKWMHLCSNKTLYIYRNRQQERFCPQAIVCQPLNSLLYKLMAFLLTSSLAHLSTCEVAELGCIGSSNRRGAGITETSMPREVTVCRQQTWDVTSQCAVGPCTSDWAPILGRLTPWASG